MLAGNRPAVVAFSYTVYQKINTTQGATVRIIPTLITALLISSSASAADFSTSIPLIEKSTETFYVSASIGKNRFELLVDTGAGYTALNKPLIETLKRSGHAQEKGAIEGIMANGDIYVLPVFRISELNVGGCIIKDFDAAEMPAGTRNLLGLSALRKAAPFAFSLEPAELRLSNCGTAVAQAN